MINNLPQELEDFYQSLDKIESVNIWNIQKELKSCNKIEEEWEKRIIIERKALLLNINKGHLIPNLTTTDIKGKLGEINFTEDEISYLDKRLRETNNTWLKARYSHIIWLTTKHNEYAEIAIDNYIETINRIVSKEAREIVILLSAILNISKKSKKRGNQAKEIALALISAVPKWYKGTVLSTILENNILDQESLLQIADSLPSWIENDDSPSYLNNKSTLELGLTLFQKVGKPFHLIYGLLAQNEDLMLAQHEKESDFIRLTTIANKAQFLKKAGKLQESEKLFQEFNRLKEKVSLSKLSIELDPEVTELLNEFLRLKSSFLLSHPSEFILSYLSVADEILVDPDFITSQANELIKNSVFHLFTTCAFDINGNFKKLEDTEKFNSERIRLYSLSHGITCYSVFLKTFVEGFIQGKLNYYKVYAYLENFTWYGSRFSKSVADEESDKNSSWLTMLAPGIHNLFTQFEQSVILNTNKVNNFILAIDSLTIKFEGALRDFICLTGGNTTTEKKGELQEQLLEELLENQKVLEYFTRRDIELFKFTFTKRGRNIRNNVAHSFMRFSDYNLQTAALVFFCLLRLGKYNITEKQ